MAVAEIQQMTGGGRRTLAVVEGDAAPPQTRNVAVYQHHAGGAQGVVDQLLVAERLAVHHQCLAAFADEQLDGLPLLLGAVKTITHQ